MSQVKATKFRTTYVETTSSRTATATYKIEDTLEPITSAINAKKALNIKVGDKLTEDTKLICTDIRVEEIDGSCNWWFATVTYTTDPGGTTEENILNKFKIEFHGGGVEKTYCYDHSTDGKNRDKTKEVVNTAGQPFENPPTRYESEWGVSYSVYKKTIPTGIIMEYNNTINSGAFTIPHVGSFNERCLRVNISATGPYVSQGITYYEIVYTFAVNPENWDELISSRGMKELDSDAGLIDIKGADMSKTHGYPLDDKGAAIRDGDNKLDATAEPAWILFKPYVAKSFSGLGISTAGAFGSLSSDNFATGSSGFATGSSGFARLIG